MRKPTPRRNVVAAVAVTLATFALGATVAVFVGSAAAASPKKTATTADLTPAVPDTPGSSFFVINATVNAASDHEIVGSSAFPNFTKGAVDNYYSMAHSHVDNSPFAEGTASPADTGPIGQTAAAGNFEQPQYADARWPGDSGSGKASYGNQGGPYATAEAGEYKATADASEATNPLGTPGAPGKLATPRIVDLRLQAGLAAWKAKWLHQLVPTKPSLPATVPKPKPTLPVPKPKLPVPTPKVTPPHPPALTTPVATVTTPHAAVGGGSLAPPVTVRTPTLPSAGATSSRRRLASFTPPSSTSAPPSADGEWLLTSSTEAHLVAKGEKSKKVKTATGKTKTVKTKNYALVTQGESSLGRVSLAGGQIVIRGIHVTASIANDGSPSYKVDVTVAAATIGGIPVTIDQDGVHVAGQGQALPYQQASDALNGVLKQAGIQIFLVAPEVTTNSCDSGSGGGPGGGSGSGSGSDTTTSSSDQSGMGGDASSCGGQSSSSCDQSGTTGTDTTGSPLPTPGAPPSTDTTDTTSSSSCSCDQTGTSSGNGTTTSSTQGGQPGMTDTTSSSSCSSPPPTCDQSTGTGTGTGATTTSATPASPFGSTGTTGTTGTSQSGGSSMSSSCGPTSTTSNGMCAPAAAGTGTTTGSGWSGSTGTTSSDGTTGPDGGFGSFGSFGMGNQGAETVTATGVHVVFTQPVNQSGVPSQFVEHILGEVYLESLAVPAGPLPDLGLSSSSFGSSGNSFSPSSSSSSSSLGSSCGSGSSAAGGGGSGFGGSGSSGSLGSSGSAYGSSSQTSAGSAGNSLPATLAAALRKPLWLLLAYLLWQTLVIGTGASLWNWRRGDPS